MPGSRKVLLVVFESLPLGSLGCYGGFQEQTPGFDRLAAAGAVFENVYTPRVIERESAFAPAGPWSSAWHQHAERWRSRGIPVAESVCTTPHAFSEAVESETLAAFLNSSRREILTITCPEVVPSSEHGQVVALDAAIDELVDRIALADESDLLVIVTALTSHALGQDFPRLRAACVNVPLILWTEHLSAPGIRTAGLVSVGDVFPTIDAWLNEDRPWKVSGEIDLLPLANCETQTGRAELFLSGPGEFGLRTPDFHVVVRQDFDPATDGEWSTMRRPDAVIFRKPLDVWDQLDVGGTMPERRDELSQRCLDLAQPHAKSTPLTGYRSK